MAVQFIAGILAALVVVVGVYIVVVRLEAKRARLAKAALAPAESPEVTGETEADEEPPVVEAPIPGRVVEIRKRETEE